MSRYKSSSGEYVKKSVIDSRIRKAKEQVIRNQLEEYSYNYCVICGASSGVRIECSHIESVDSCQKNGHAEKSYDVDNIEILCHSCHCKRDKLTIG